MGGSCLGWLRSSTAIGFCSWHSSNAEAVGAATAWVSTHAVRSDFTRRVRGRNVTGLPWLVEQSGRAVLAVSSTAA